MARQSSIPKYRKHSSGNARVTINGRDYLLGPWTSKTSIREYDRIVAEFLASGRSPTFGIESEGYSVAMLIRDYLRQNRLRHSRGTEIRKAFGLEAAQVTLGHRNADVTQVYAERDEELAKRVALQAG